MTCPAVRPMLEPYLDGELDAVRQAQVMEHLAECRSCSEEYERMENLRAAIRGAHLRYVAPDSLRKRIQIKRPVWPWREMAIAASVLLVLSLGANIAIYKSAGSPVRQEVLSEHLRSMMGGHLVEVVSSDRHTVKPWFSGKLDFSPTVKDLAAQGFPLAGGRVDYLDGRSVAALVFHRDKHVITLFTWPSPQGAGGASTRNGYNMVDWTGDGMIFWAVSDLNLVDLQEFADLYKND